MKRGYLLALLIAVIAWPWIKCPFCGRTVMGWEYREHVRFHGSMTKAVADAFTLSRPAS